jgi:hypothetical protein
VSEKLCPKCHGKRREKVCDLAARLAEAEALLIAISQHKAFGLVVFADNGSAEILGEKVDALTRAASGAAGSPSEGA